MPTLTINGEKRSFPEAPTVSSLLTALGLKPEAIAVELNRAIVPRAEYPGQRLADGDELEIVTFVGGGAS